MAATAIVLALSAWGCGGGRDSAAQALDRALKDSNTTKLTVAKFSGTVTVDGQPPGIKVIDKHRLVIMLYDPKNPPTDGHPVLFADCMPEPNDGFFEFSSYERGDGIPPGSYIALFLDLPTSWAGGYKGADLFKNRFNDPDRNEKEPQFKVELTAPGRTDWQFNLVTQDNAPPPTPGPKSILKPTSKK
ncbi:MAG TPA: hypothetical protein VFG04_15805 [Planctomycetaceae bacterium]|nr:hypothetical protein [Planctomycetaceae bacterium]